MTGADAPMREAARRRCAGLDEVMPGARMRHHLGFRHTIAWTKPADG